MRTAHWFVIVASTFFLMHAAAQDYSGLTISSSSGGNFTEADGTTISPGQAFGFAHATGIGAQASRMMRLSDFTYADFDDATLNGNLSGFQGCDFDHASLQQATLSALGLSAFGGDSFEFANLQGATLLGNTTSSWQQIDFYHADLQGALFLGNGTSSFQGVDLQGADLQGADFSGHGLSSFQGINLQGANLQGATFDISTIFPDGKNYLSTFYNWQASAMVLVAAPEPSSYLLGLVAVGALIFLRARRHRV